MFRPLLSKNRAAQKIRQMVKKSPFSDKVITPEETGESLGRRGLRVCGTLSQQFATPKKNAQLRKETGRFGKRSRD
ncbi:conserved hypothetical protein [Pseudomonas sp. 8O]|nr:conserved hypothetical protein [Pseudomonas sp. 8O]